jgi:hypothetical protein
MLLQEIKMRSLHFSTFAACLAFGLAAPVSAQAPAATTPADTAPAMCQAGLTKGARGALVALQTAVNGKVQADIAARLAAAQAVAKSNDDRCFIALMQVRASADSGDLRPIGPALETVLASGSVPPTRVAALYESLAKMHYDKGAFPEAAAAFERTVAIEPTRAAAVIMLAETRVKQNRAADAFPLYRKAIALERAAGRAADQNWYRRAVAMTHQARSPLSYGFAREWVAAYPSAKNWRDAIRIYGDVSGADDGHLLDLYRLQRVTKSLEGESDHARYAQALLSRGFPGEAKAMLEEGTAAGAVDRNRASIKSYLAQATAKAAGDRASLDGQSAAALASPAAKQAMVLGEAYYGYGDHAKAAAMFRAALGKSGVDAELANLRLGMALAASGDKAGAATALGLVKGTRAEIAQYWLTYAALRS